MSENDLDRVAADRRELLYDWPAVSAALDRMAAEISRSYREVRPIYLTVLHGGLIVAGVLAPRITVDLDFDYAHVTRYRGATQGGALHWLAHPQRDPNGREVLLVDDILDEGTTLAELRAHFLARGARRVRIATLAVKRHQRRVPGLEADFCGLEVPDRYVFGMGMDVAERGRNLPGIYALREPR